jgi:alginate O-acetyltransferase complex protein AlgI
VIYLRTMLSGQGDESQITPFTLALIVLGLSLHAVPRDMPARLAQWFASTPGWMWGVTAGVGIAMIDALGPDGVAPFIYFQF